ncbi:acyl carrier protein [Paralimibaculum aggregatum]|uniref:acyl carrier protein n=1 Tax=Paralimibaculum aggregatum TaxID=3036245 RepID=UPI0025571001|nr:phosphopantetheine-binding protein [Limibaculum sp. NKW23]
MSDQVAERIAEIIAEQALVEPDQIRPETTPEDLGLDSLALVEVVFGIEEAFDISVPYNANDPESTDFDISNFAAIVTGVKKLIADREA